MVGLYVLISIPFSAALVLVLVILLLVMLLLLLNSSSYYAVFRMCGVRGGGVRQRLYRRRKRHYHHVAGGRGATTVYPGLCSSKSASCTGTAPDCSRGTVFDNIPHIYVGLVLLLNFHLIQHHQVKLPLWKWSIWCSRVLFVAICFSWLLH
jgi:hypothetical protein